MMDFDLNVWQIFLLLMVVEVVGYNWCPQPLLPDLEEVLFNKLIFERH